MVRDPKEYKLHVAALDHILSAFPQVKPIHVPNQTRDATEAFFNKRMGVVQGVSDFLIGWSRKDYGGAGVGVLEIKAPDGRLTTPQNKFLSWAHHIGWGTGTAKSVREVHNTLVGWGLKPLHAAIREPDYRTKEDRIKEAYSFYSPLED